MNYSCQSAPRSSNRRFHILSAVAIVAVINYLLMDHLDYINDSSSSLYCLQGTFRIVLPFVIRLATGFLLPPLCIQLDSRIIVNCIQRYSSPYMEMWTVIQYRDTL